MWASRAALAVGLAATATVARARAADYVPIASLVEGKAFGFAEGETRYYTSVGVMEDMSITYLGATRDSARGMLYRFELLGVFGEGSPVSLVVNAEGYPISLRVEHKPKEGSTKPQASWSCDVEVLEDGVRVRRVDSEDPERSGEWTTKPPKEFREDFRSKEHFLLYDPTSPLVSLFPILYQIRDGKPAFEFSSIKVLVGAGWVGPGKYVTYRVQRKETKAAKVDGRDVVVRTYVVGPTTWVKANRTLVEDSLVVLADDTGVAYGLEYGKGSSWRLSRIDMVPAH